MGDRLDEYFALQRLRTRNGLCAMNKRSERTGGYRYGFRLRRDGKTYERHPEEFPRLCRMLEMRYRLRLSYRAIANAFRLAAIPTKKRKGWVHTTVKGIIGRWKRDHEIGATWTRESGAWRDASSGLWMPPRSPDLV